VCTGGDLLRSTTTSTPTPGRTGAIRKDRRRTGSVWKGFQRQAVRPREVGGTHPVATKEDGPPALIAAGRLRRPFWIERQLAHVEGNSVRAAYNYADYLPERRKMMQWWADWLDEQAQM